MRRVAICVLAWLLLGSIANYAQVAMSESPGLLKKLGLRTQRSISTLPDEGLIVYTSDLATSATYGSSLVSRFVFAEIPVVAERPAWLRIAPTLDDSSTNTTSQVAVGWPLRSVSRSYETVQGICPDPAYLSNPRRWALSERLRKIPLFPLWPGFLLNAIVWGFPVLLVPLVNGRRRARRTRRGLCVRCGYDLRSGSLTICPECGPAPGHAS